MLEKIKNVKENVEKTKNCFSGETLEVLLSRPLTEFGKKQRQMEKIKEKTKLILDFNINGNEIQ